MHVVGELLEARPFIDCKEETDEEAAEVGETPEASVAAADDDADGMREA